MACLSQKHLSGMCIPSRIPRGSVYGGKRAARAATCTPTPCATAPCQHAEQTHSDGVALALPSFSDHAYTFVHASVPSHASVWTSACSVMSVHRLLIIYLVSGLGLQIVCGKLPGTAISIIKQTGGLLSGVIIPSLKVDSPRLQAPQSDTHEAWQPGNSPQSHQHLAQSHQHLAEQA